MKHRGVAIFCNTPKICNYSHPNFDLADNPFVGEGLDPPLRLKCKTNRNCVIPQAFLIYSGDRPYGRSPMTQVCKPGSVLTAIYLVPQLLTGSSRLLGTVGPTYCSSTALLRIEFAAPQCLHEASALLPHFFTLTALAGGGISLLYLSWGHPRRALPVILALWSPDFPHTVPFVPARGCPTWSLKYCILNKVNCQMSCKIFSERIYYKEKYSASL